MRSKWIPGLDGLRAIAVAAVLLFHLSSGYLPGGFLGVDLFFVISGYLITRLLLGEAAATGRVRLGAFYRRRVKRLLPAVFALVTVVMVAGTFIWRDEQATLTGSALASLGYVTNWYLIGDQQSYFVAMGRPPMLQHLWSLAIEEQYYLVWAPIVIAVCAGGLVTILRRHRPRYDETARRRISGTRGPTAAKAPARPALRVAVVATVAAIASTVAMAVIAIRTGVPYRADSSRVYFGTDTHAMGLLLGSAAGAVTVALRSTSLPRGWPRSGRPSGRSGRDSRAVAADLTTLSALGVLLWWMWRVDEYAPWMYRGGFLGFAAVAVVVICGVARSRSRLGRALDCAPLRWIGRRSYGIYLWHWPVFVVTRPLIDVQGPEWLLGVTRVGVTVAIAAASYRYLEQPLRRRRWWPARRTAAAAAGQRESATDGTSSFALSPSGGRRPHHWMIPALGLGCVAVLLAAQLPALQHPVLAASVPSTGGNGSAAVSADGGSGNAAEDMTTPPVPTSQQQPAGPRLVGPFVTRPDAATPRETTSVRSMPLTPPSETSSPGETSSLIDAAPTTAASSSAPATPGSTGRAPVTTSKPASTPTRSTSTSPARSSPPAHAAEVSAFGDSVLLGASRALRAAVGTVSVDAVVARQSWDTLDAVMAAAKSRTLAPVVLIHTGTNGLVPPKQLATTLRALQDRTLVIVFNDHVDRPWEAKNNKTLAAARKYDNTVLVDWDKAVAAHPAWVGADGIHVTPTGARAYAALVAKVLGG